jgi:hypothetical protein
LLKLTDKAFPTVVFFSIAKPQDETISNADNMKLLLDFSDEIVELVDKASADEDDVGDVDSLLRSPLEYGYVENSCIAW